MFEKENEVSSYFGYWPELADAKIRSFSRSELGTIDMTIYYIDEDQSKSGTINLSFKDASKMNLSDYLSENVIDKLSITNATPHRVTIEPCCGLGGSFICSEIKVGFESA